ADRSPDAFELTRQLELVARLDDPLEAHTVDAGEEGKAPTVLLAAEHRDRAGLGHRLDDEDAGHDRPSREVPREVPLVRAYGLACNHAVPRLELDDLVDQEKGVAMRQDLFDLRA